MGDQLGLKLEGEGELVMGKKMRPADVEDGTWEPNEGRRMDRWTWTKAGMDGSCRGGIYAPGLDSDSQNVVLIRNSRPVLDNLIAPFYNNHVPVTIESIRFLRTNIATSSTSVVPITAFPGFCPTTLSTMVRTTPLAILECCFSWSIPCLELKGEGTLEIHLEL
jgi:hypothetical protein